MARNNDRDRDRGSKRVLKDNRPRGKKKVCIFCREDATWVDFKDVSLLKRYVSDRGKIRPRRVSGNCAQHQRDVQVAIKTARELALLPYLQRTVNERGPGRGPRRPHGEAGAERPFAAGDRRADDVQDPDQEEEAVEAQLEEVGV